MKAGSMVSCTRKFSLTLGRRCPRLSSTSTPTSRLPSCSYGLDARLTLPSDGSQRRTIGSMNSQAAFPDLEVPHGQDDRVGDNESDPDVLLLALGMKRSDLYQLASRPLTPLKISDMYKYATTMDKIQRLRNAQFLHRELPIRVAQRAVDLLTLPNGLSDIEHVQQVACAYITKLHSLLSVPLPRTVEDDELFTDRLQLLALDRSYFPKAISQGLVQWFQNKRDLGIDRLQEMEDALYRFFTARVGLRLLIEHHVLSSRRECSKALTQTICMFPDKNDNHAGCIHSNLDLVKEISLVADLVVQQTKEFYGFSPEIEVLDCIDKKNDRDFTYITNHLHYMVEELLKNSCRATIRNVLGHEGKGINSQPALGSLERATLLTLPPVRVVVVKGEEDVTIKVADKGGGIRRSRIGKIWQFAHSTANEEENYSGFGMDNLSGTRIRGFGLPLCRIYARYLGGELTLRSMEGYGLDAYLHLPRLGDACENLPSLVRHSPGGRDSTPGRALYQFTTTRNNAATTSRISTTHCTQFVAPLSTTILKDKFIKGMRQGSKVQRIHATSC